MISKSINFNLPMKSKRRLKGVIKAAVKRKTVEFTAVNKM